MDKKHSVLIVDDEADILDILEDLLESHEYPIKVFKTKDGLDALTKINRMQFDLVDTDINMPKMTCKDLLAQIRNVHKDFKPKNVMIISGLLEKDVLKDSGKGVSILKKPFTSDDFNKYVKVILGPKKKASSGKVNVEYINPFIEATQNVLDVMVGVKSEKDFVFVKEDGDTLGDITGIIPLNSKKYLGSLAITFSKKVYLKVMSSMLDEEITDIDDDNKDGVAEFCNQVYGNARITLNKMGYELGPAFPTVVYGENHKVSHVVDGNVLAVYFKTEYGDFVIECVVTNK
jgi:chemotaxis protein CheX